MRHYANRGKTERTFQVGDHVYLKLQPYMQTSVAKRPNQKLSAKYYSPYQVLQKIGTVAYRIELPKRSNIHPVFHVSQLKRRIELKTTANSTLPVIDYWGNPGIQPEAILYRKADKKGNLASTQVLVK